VRFEAVWFWLLVPPAFAYLLWLSRRSYAHLGRTARWLSLSVRALVIVALTAALCRPFLARHSTHGHLLVLLDVSRSVSSDNIDAELDAADRLLQQAAAANPSPQYSIVAFGGKPTLLASSQTRWAGWTPELRERLRYAVSLPALYGERTRLISENGSAQQAHLTALEERIRSIERMRDDVAGDYTDAEQAVRLALNCGSIDEARTVYLFTDGNFNRGRWQAAWGDSAARGAVLHTVLLDRPSPPEVAAAEVVTPPTVRVDQGFSAEARIASTLATKAEVRIFKDGVLVQQRPALLQAGDNALSFGGLSFREKGFHTIEIAIRPEQDTQVSNNTVRTLVIVPGEARVLYVDGNLNQVHYLKSALELQNIQVEARSAAGVPENLSELLGFDAFILCNVPADRLSLRQMQMVRTYVQDFGGGFLMLGGEESFGLGGYYNTPIEEILPVRMPIQKDMTRPSLALMLVIDKSGSMEGVKIQLAKRAAIATAEALNPKDLIGVVGFDSEARVLLELTPAADRAGIADHVAGLDAGGGTFLYPALEEAHRRLVESNARRKHIIVLSDGQTQGFGYEDLASLMSADGITSSTVGIGDGADMNLLEAIANAGGGRAYFTSDFHSIPQIFTREALRASKSMLVERLVVPVVSENDALLAEIDTDELPALTGYVATTAKPAASVILTSDSGDPLLAKWRYGLGRTVAFTSEPKPRWAEDWLDWEDFSKFWSQVVRGVSGEDLGRKTIVECTHQVTDGVNLLSADVRDETGDFVDDASLTVAQLTAQGTLTELPVRQRSSGLFEAKAGAVVFGADQQFVWRVEGRTQETQTVSYGFVRSFSPEFATLAPSQATAKELHEAANGDTMPLDDVSLKLNPASVRMWLDFAPALLIVALLLVPIDILIRRLG
jgi:uncharacterized membrane protein/uncharacterized protein YegL